MTNNYIGGIDGLRALAVLSVMIYHLDFSSLPGGFIGVDIFFVISGFVVSYSLGQHQHESFKKFVLFFYARRVLRILPALFFCLAVTALLTVMFVPESWLSRSNMDTGVAAIVGLSNFVLAWDTDGYFSPRSEYNPFTHTWSLAVEEQFYLVFPALFYIWYVYKQKQRKLPWAIQHAVGLLACLSFVYCIYASLNLPNQAYYLIFSRFWELAAGVVLFQIIDNPRFKATCKSAGAVLGGVGMACIAVGFVFTDKTLFPFPWAILAVFGTMCLIAHIYHADRPTVVLTLFNLASARWVGKLSYSLYLWHWPIYTLLRWTTGMQEFVDFALAFVLTFIAGAISYYLVERNFRKLRLLSKTPWRAITAGVAAAGLTFFFFQEVQFRSYVLAQSVTQNTYDWYPYKNNHGVSEEQTKDERYQGKNLFVMGDSHAGAYHALVRGLEIKTGLTVHYHWKGGCAVIPIRKTWHNDDCEAFVKTSLDRIISESAPGDIVFIPTLRLPRLSQQDGEIGGDVIEDFEAFTHSDAFEQQLLRDSALLDDLTEAGLIVILEAPKPVFKAPAFRCSDWFNRDNPSCVGGLTMSKAFIESFRMPVMEALDRLAGQHDNVLVWDVMPYLCGGDECKAIDDGVPLFFDGDHLSGYANRLLLPEFMGLLDDIWISPSKELNVK